MKDKYQPITCQNNHIIGLSEKNATSRELLILRHAQTTMPDTPDVAATVSGFALVQIECDLCGGTADKSIWPTLLLHSSIQANLFNIFQPKEQEHD